MSAQHIGRVGGLAAALGVGTVLFLGSGVAAASPDASPPTPNHASAPDRAAAHDAVKDVKEHAKSLLSHGKDVGKKGAKDKPKAVDATTDTSADKPADGVAAHRVVKRAPSVSRLVHDIADQVSAQVSSLPKPKAPALSAKSKIEAGVAEAEAPAAEPAEPAEPVKKVVAPARSLVANIFDDVLKPFVGTRPDAPAETPAGWTLLAAARRELGAGAATPNLLAAQPSAANLLTANPISATPTVGIDHGIINGTTGAVSTGGLPLSYTVIGDPSAGGKVRLNSADGTFTFLPYATVVDNAGTEKFTVLVAETTPFDTALQQIPIVGSFVPQVLVIVHQVPVVSDVLAPLIGHAQVVGVDVNVGELAPAGTPVAYTYKVTSFDGTPISMNYFPATGLQKDDQAPTIFIGAGLSGAGDTNPYSTGATGVGTFRDAGYNVVTWDSRGEHASGGVLQLDNPFFEGRDVSAMIDYVAKQPGTKLDGPNDPRMGMVGGSYGGGIQWVTAGTDNRVDAIVPTISWNSLNSSLYPNDAFKTSYAALLLLSLVTTGANINNQLYAGIFTGALLGVLTDSQQAVLASSGPTSLVNKITAPTLVIQGTVDVLFPLQQAMDNAAILDANGVPVKMVWFCGGHGNCETPPGDSQQMVEDATMSWLNAYVMHKGQNVDDGLPKFQWIDQNGDHYTSDLLPTDPGFAGTPVTASGGGGVLAIVPVLGGSGPGAAGIPFGLGDGTKATNAVNTTVTAPSGSTTQVVGAPELTMTYSGIGTSRHVYAQIVDDQTGQVVGNVVTAVPVTLDGKEHTVTIPMEAVAYTLPPGHTATVQITSSATPFLNFTEFGVVNISDVQVSLPTVGSGADAQPADNADQQVVSV